MMNMKKMMKSFMAVVLVSGSLAGLAFGSELVAAVPQAVLTPPLVAPVSPEFPFRLVDPFCRVGLSVALWGGATTLIYTLCSKLNARQKSYIEKGTFFGIGTVATYCLSRCPEKDALSGGAVAVAKRLGAHVCAMGAIAGVSWSLYTYGIPLSWKPWLKMALAGVPATLVAYLVTPFILKNMGYTSL